MRGARLVADLGGSNLRLGISPGPGRVEALRRYRVARFPGLGAALAAYLAETGAPPPAEAVIAAAGPVEGGRVRLTNLDWTVEAEAVAAACGAGRVRLVNDLEAVARALPHLEGADLAPVGPPRPPRPEAPRLAVNVGTGFGAAAALPVDGDWHATAGEPGHMTFAAARPEETDLLAIAGTVEDLLSGAGLVRLWRHAGGTGAAPDAAGVAARAGGDPAAARALGQGAALLGRVAGDLVLAHGAWGGAFFCGSVAGALLSPATAGGFRAAFAAKGKMRARMEAVPSAFIRRPEPALHGLTFGPA